MATDETLHLHTTLEPRGPAAALVLTDEQVAALGAGKAAAVQVTANGATVAARIARMGGENLLGFSKKLRADLGVEIGDVIDVVIALDAGPRSSRCRPRSPPRSRMTRLPRPRSTPWRHRGARSSPAGSTRPNATKRSSRAWSKHSRCCVKVAPGADLCSGDRRGAVAERSRRPEGHRPFLTVRSRMPNVARKADSGTIGKRSLRSPLTFDQS